MGRFTCCLCYAVEEGFSTYSLNDSFAVMGQGQVAEDQEERLLDGAVLQRRPGGQLQDAQQQGAARGSSARRLNGMLSRTRPAERAATLRTTAYHKVLPAWLRKPEWEAPQSPGDGPEPVSCLRVRAEAGRPLSSQRPHGCNRACETLALFL